jgi:hypothetical protein
MTQSIHELVLVYNADWSIPGAVEYVADMLRGNDNCALCAITHNTVTEKSEWKACKARLPVSVRGLYRNQLSPELARAAAGSFPCVLVRVDGGYERLVERATLERCKGDPSELMKAIDSEAEKRGLRLR